MSLLTDLPMTEPDLLSQKIESDLLSQKIEELKQWQRLVWRRIADPQITPFERSKLRDHLRESDSALRQCLTMMYEQIRISAK